MNRNEQKEWREKGIAFLGKNSSDSFPLPYISPARRIRVEKTVICCRGTKLNKPVNMHTTCIIPRSTIEKRYDKAREDFNDQYDNSPYKLKCKEFYLGGGVENYEVANKILLMNEEEIAKSYLEDCDPKDWQSMRRYREDLMCDATDIYKTAIAMVKADIQKLKTIQDEVESFLDDHIGENMDGHYLDGDINYEIDLIDKNADVRIHYDAYNHKEWDNGNYLTPSSSSGYIDTEYTVTVFDECGNEEFEFNGNFQI